MSTAGRKRKEGKRTPSGQLSRALQNPKLVAQIARAKPDVLRALGNPELSTPAGRLYMLGEMPDYSYSAAVALATLSVQYDRAIAAPPRHPLAQDIEKAAKGRGFGGDYENVGWVRSRIAAMDEAKASVPGHVWKALEHVIILGHWPDTYEQRLAAIDGCKRLADHWGIGLMRRAVAGRAGA